MVAAVAWVRELAEAVQRRDGDEDIFLGDGVSGSGAAALHGEIG